MNEGLGEVAVADGTATVTFERDIEATPARVWELLTVVGEISAWLAPAEMQLWLGGAVRIDFGDGSGGVVTGRIVEIDPPHRLVYTWLLPGEPESVVEWSLEPHGGATRLSLVHRTLPTAMAGGYGAGWHAHLDQLQASGEGRAVPDWDERFGELMGRYSS